MNLFLDRHQKLLQVLLKEKVEFIIIGGYSVIFHGYKRTTGDVDIWIRPDNKNGEKLISALGKCGISPAYLSKLGKADFTGILTLNIWEEPNRVDFLTRVSLVNYEEAEKMKITAEIDGMLIPFLHLNHLILTKFNTGRSKDKADIEELQKIAAMRTKKKSKK